MFSTTGALVGATAAAAGASSSSSSSSSAPLGRMQRGASTAVFNEIGLLQKFEEICLPGDYAWAETLLVAPDEAFHVEDVNDDLKREVAFYQHTLSAVKQGLLQLEQSGVPFQRPDDYYAEMVRCLPFASECRVSAAHTVEV